MTKRFTVVDAHNCYMLYDDVTGRSASMGDGVDVFLDEHELGTEAFRQAWESIVNSDVETYMEAYFSDLYDLVIYNSPEYMDCYSVVLEPCGTPAHPIYCGCLCLSDNPEHPQGFSQISECDPKYLAETQRRISFTSLPQNVQRHIAKRLED